jgi:hypothetical protein
MQGDTLISYYTLPSFYLHFCDFVSKIGTSLLTAIITKRPFFGLFYLRVTYKMPILGPVLLTGKNEKQVI